MAGRLVAATQALWARVAPKMLPTPAKFHYLFNMRDISKARTFFGTCHGSLLIYSTPCKHLCHTWQWVLLLVQRYN